MTKKILLITFVFVAVISSYALAQETLTLTTYYPAPFGAYDRMRLVPRASIADADCDDNTLGMIYRKMNNYDEALKAVQEAVRLSGSPPNPKYTKHLEKIKNDLEKRNVKK